MKKITMYANTVLLLSMVLVETGKDALARRFEQMDSDRGDVPGWAIASGAACVLAALVYAAYSKVINKWIGKIS